MAAPRRFAYSRWADKVRTVDCGGGGDCLFLSVSHALEHASELEQLLLMTRADDYVTHHWKKAFGSHKLSTRDRFPFHEALTESRLRLILAASLVSGHSDDAILFWFSMIASSSSDRDVLEAFRFARCLRRVKLVPSKHGALSPDITNDIRTDIASKIMNPDEYWGDEWAIQSLERVLNIKIVVISQTESERRDGRRAGVSKPVVQTGHLHGASWDPYLFCILHLHKINSKSMVSPDHYRAMYEFGSDRFVFTRETFPKSIKALARAQPSLQNPKLPWYVSWSHVPTRPLRKLAFGRALA